MEVRLLEEYRELNKKIAKLESFIEKEEFKKLDETQQDLLKEQYGAMIHYSGILTTRILHLMKK